MSGMDWVPCLDYGTEQSNTGSNLVVPLLAPDSGIDVIGKIEDTDDIFIHRIVGEVYWNVTGITAGTDVMMSIMPLQFNVENFSPQLPWNTPSSFWGSALGENVNLRYWALRTFHAAGTSMTNYTQAAGACMESIPWYFHWDIKPRQKVGSRLNIWPCFVFSMSDSEGAVRLRTNLRVLASGR